MASSRKVVAGSPKNPQKSGGKCLKTHVLCWVLGKKTIFFRPIKYFTDHSVKNAVFLHTIWVKKWLFWGKWGFSPCKSLQGDENEYSVKLKIGHEFTDVHPVKFYRVHKFEYPVKFYLPNSQKFQNTILYRVLCKLSQISKSLENEEVYIFLAQWAVYILFVKVSIQILYKTNEIFLLQSKNIFLLQRNILLDKFPQWPCHGRRKATAGSPSSSLCARTALDLHLSTLNFSATFLVGDPPRESAIVLGCAEFFGVIGSAKKSSEVSTFPRFMDTFLLQRS